MKILTKYRVKYISCLPQSLQYQIMAEVKRNISQLLLNKEEKQEAIEDAHNSKICNLEELIHIEYI